MKERESKDQKLRFDITKKISPTRLDWIRSLKIPELNLKASKENFSIFLLTLCNFLFPEYGKYTPHYIPGEIKSSQKEIYENFYRLKFVFSLLHHYNIIQESSQKIKKSLNVLAKFGYENTNIDQLLAFSIFDKLLQDIYVYLNVDQNFLHALTANLEERYQMCSNLSREIEDVAVENQFYQQKLKKIHELLNNSKDGLDHNVISKIIEDVERASSIKM